jgi:hypothetical protein
LNGGVDNGILDFDYLGTLVYSATGACDNDEQIHAAAASVGDLGTVYHHLKEELV